MNDEEIEKIMQKGAYKKHGTPENPHCIHKVRWHDKVLYVCCDCADPAIFLGILWSERRRKR